MPITTLIAQSQQSLLQVEQVLSILTTRPPALQNLARQRLRVLWPKKLRVLRKPNVHETANRSGLLLLRATGGGCRVKGRELDRVSVYLADVKILAYFSYLGSRDVVGCAPDALSGFMLWDFRSCLILYFWCLVRTWSDNVSQCARSISVTTRPGASGVPLWSSLVDC